MDDSLSPAFDWYQRRISEQALELPDRRPWEPVAGAEVRQAVREILAITEASVPTIQARPSGTTDFGDYTVERLQGESWPRCRTAAYLYQPAPPSSAPLPLVMLLCGHADGGKDAPSYRAMARLLALAGSAVLVIDNLGQGERASMGHWNVTGPFEAGLTLQGLIVLETQAWLDWAMRQERFDSDRVAAVGNSGGGMLGMFLSALESERLAAICSSGTLSSFEFLARKETGHCACNIFPGSVGRLEMWEILSLFAPKPLFLFQGSEDEYFPHQLFTIATRRIARAYSALGCDESFLAKIFPGGHPWNDDRRLRMLEFLTPILRLPPLPVLPSQEATSPGECFSSWPADALTTEGLASLLAGRTLSLRTRSAIFPLDPACPPVDPAIVGPGPAENLATMAAF